MTSVSLNSLLAMLHVIQRWLASFCARCYQTLHLTGFLLSLVVRFIHQKLNDFFFSNKTSCHPNRTVIILVVKQIGHQLRIRLILVITDTITKNKYSKKRALARELDRCNVNDENNSTVCFTSDVWFWHQEN